MNTIQAAHPRTNTTFTRRRYNEQGVCTYCMTRHNSSHGHGYLIEYLLRNEQEVLVSVRPDHGAPYVLTQDASRWMKTQRKELLEKQL